MCKSTGFFFTKVINRALNLRKFNMPSESDSKIQCGYVRENGIQCTRKPSSNLLLCWQHSCAPKKHQNNKVDQYSSASCTLLVIQQVFSILFEFLDKSSLYHLLTSSREINRWALSDLRDHLPPQHLDLEEVAGTARLGILRLFTRCAIPLVSLDIEFGSEEASILWWVIERCSLDKLTSFSYRISNSQPYYVLCCEQPQVAMQVIKNINRELKERAVDFVRTLKLDPSFCAHLPSLVRLEAPCIFSDKEALCLTGLKNLANLYVHIWDTCVGWIDNLEWIVEKCRKLRYLQFWTHCREQVPDLETCKIKSLSLEMLKMRGKHFDINVICPRLRKVICFLPRDHLGSRVRIIEPKNIKREDLKGSDGLIRHVIYEAVD